MLQGRATIVLVDQLVELADCIIISELRANGTFILFPLLMSSKHK